MPWYSVVRMWYLLYFFHSYPFLLLFHPAGQLHIANFLWLRFEHCLLLPMVVVRGYQSCFVRPCGLHAFQDRSPVKVAPLGQLEKEPVYYWHFVLWVRILLDGGEYALNFVWYYSWASGNLPLCRLLKSSAKYSERDLSLPIMCCVVHGRVYGEGFLVFEGRIDGKPVAETHCNLQHYGLLF